MIVIGSCREILDRMERLLNDSQKRAEQLTRERDAAEKRINALLRDNQSMITTIGDMKRNYHDIAKSYEKSIKMCEDERAEYIAKIAEQANEIELLRDTVQDLDEHIIKAQEQAQLQRDCREYAESEIAPVESAEGMES